MCCGLVKLGLVGMGLLRCLFDRFCVVSYSVVGGSIRGAVMLGRRDNWNQGLKNLFMRFSWKGYDGVLGHRLPSYDGSEKVKMMSTRDGIFFDDSYGNDTGPDILEAGMRRAMKALYGDEGEIAHWEQDCENKYYAGDVGSWLEKEKFCVLFSFKLHFDDCVPEPFDEESL